MDVISPNFSTFSPSVLNNSFFDDFVQSFDNAQPTSMDTVVDKSQFLSVAPQQQQLYSTIPARPVPTLTLPPKVVKKVTLPSATVAVSTVPAATTSVAGWTNDSCNTAKIANVQHIVTTLKKRGEDNVLASSNNKERLLYQPYRYQLVTDVQASAFACPVQTVLYTVQVVDAETKEEVLKGATTILQAGEGFHSMNVKTAGQFKGELRVLFLDCSYHHSNRPFALKVSYFLNNELETPCLVRVSPPFRVIARPPDRGGEKNCNKKRKKAASSDDEEEEEQVARPAKKRKTAAPSQQLPSCESFMVQFNALLESNFRPLAAHDQQRAIQQVLVKLYEQSAQAFAQKDNDAMRELANLL